MFREYVTMKYSPNKWDICVLLLLIFLRQVLMKPNELFDILYHYYVLLDYSNLCLGVY